MDYDSFRQMVLGANLKSMKTKEAQLLCTAQKTGEATQETLPVYAVPKETEVGRPETGNEVSDYKAFRLRIGQLEPNAQSLTAFLKDVKAADKVAKIVSVDFDASLLLKLAKLVDSVETAEIASFLADLEWLLSEIGKSKNAGTVVRGMLSRSDKGLLRERFGRAGVSSQTVALLTAAN